MDENARKLAGTKKRRKIQVRFGVSPTVPWPPFNLRNFNGMDFRGTLSPNLNRYSLNLDLSAVNFNFAYYLPYLYPTGMNKMGSYAEATEKSRSGQSMRHVPINFSVAPTAAR
jgi:hypothetical protein